CLTAYMLIWTLMLDGLPTFFLQKIGDLGMFVDNGLLASVWAIDVGGLKSSNRLRGGDDANSGIIGNNICFICQSSICRSSLVIYEVRNMFFINMRGKISKKHTHHITD
ncbi:hypothetical protein ACJX0J_029204, partial [Zea mays]